MSAANVFTPEHGEVLIGVVRPSFWALVLPLTLAALLVLFPFLFAFALLGLGPFGLGIGAASVLSGAWRLRRIRKRWLLGSLFVTNQRVADLVALHRKPTFVSVAWRDVGTIAVTRTLRERLLGTGTIAIESKAAGFTIVARAVPDPVTVAAFLHEVQSGGSI